MSGRPERPVDPADGPVAAFAHQLRQLRREAGNPSYRQLAERAHYSHTVISDAARGTRLATLPVTLAFVEACNGDLDLWRARWHLHRELALAAGIPVSDLAEHDHQQPADAPTVTGATPVAPVAADEVPADRRPGWLRRGALIAAGLLVVALVSFAAGGQLHATTVKINDGTDPKLAGCTDTTTLDTADVVLDKAVVLRGTQYKAGDRVGTVILFYSPHCQGAWPRFHPDPVWASPSDGIVTIEADRPIDNTATVWTMGHVDQAYADLLLTGIGCVIAKAKVIIVGQNAAATGHTRCLPAISNWPR
jgi:hypothetical protein